MEKLKIFALLKKRRNDSHYRYKGTNILRILEKNFLDWLNSYFQFWQNPLVFLHTTHSLRKLKNSQFGRTCIVLGNGPSLNYLRIESLNLKNYDLYAVNDYWKNSIALQHIPKRYFILDPGYFIEGSQSMLLLMKYLKSHPNIELWVPAKHKNLKILNSINFFCFDGRNRSAFNKNLFPHKPISVSSIVVHFALGHAAFMGYKSILICGMDSSSYISRYYKNGFLYESQIHAYDDPEIHIVPYKTTSAMLEDAARGFHDLGKFSKYGVQNLAIDTLVDEIPPFNQ